MCPQKTATELTLWRELVQEDPDIQGLQVSWSSQWASGYILSPQIERSRVVDGALRLPGHFMLIGYLIDSCLYKIHEVEDLEDHLLFFYL